MCEYLISGGKRLVGDVCVDTSKNASLPIIAACLLTNDEVYLEDLPQITDIQKMLGLFQSLGGRVLKNGNATILCSSGVNKYNLASSLVGEIRSSIFLLGPLLAKCTYAKIAYPGGCNIGKRPIDLHIKGLKSLGVSVIETDDGIMCDASKFTGGIVHLDMPSVGATENLMMVGAIAKGKSVVILNAAREPEIVDLANFINKMGGKVRGAGTSVITVEGVSELHSVTYKPIKDRIVAGTFMIATAMTGGKIWLKDVNYEHVFSLILKLRNSGCKIDVKNDIICIENHRRMFSCPIVSTNPYPGFPTDLQAQMLALQTISDGISVITENLFDSRFKHVPELVKMGAKITTRDRVAVVRGVEYLHGAKVNAEDLRGGAALVLAGLVARGETVVENIHYIERGYECLEQKLSMLGAQIERKVENEKG